VDERDKEQQRDRYRRSLGRLVGHEEQKRRKADSAQRRAGRRDGRSSRRGWDEDEDGDDFEKIRRHRPVAGGKARDAVDLAGLPHATVAEVHHGQVVLDNGATARVAGHLAVDPEFRLAVGDGVAFAATEGQARVEARLARRTCLSRPDPGNPHRSLVIAANVDLAVIVVAARSPPLRPGLIDRLLLALAHGGVAPAICVNKVDLLDDAAGLQQLQSTLAPYLELGCPTVLCSATTGLGIDLLRHQLAARTCVFVGHSGVGKSSVLNAIDPQGARSTGDVRQYDGRGRHTTTWSSLRSLEDGTRIIDTPGVRSFGLDRLDPAQIRAGFGEFEPFSTGCRYADCRHLHEPQCAVRQAAAAGSVSADRYASYRRILDDM
jgi:ribosome biogenesis GTPase